jgi:hypothetical protein
VEFDEDEADVRAVALMIAFQQVTEQHQGKSLTFSADTLNVIRAVVAREIHRIVNQGRSSLPLGTLD